MRNVGLRDHVVRSSNVDGSPATGIVPIENRLDIRGKVIDKVLESGLGALNSEPTDQAKIAFCLARVQRSVQPSLV